MKHDIPVYYREDKKGWALLKKRAKSNGMSRAEYLRYAVSFEAGISDKLKA